MIWYELSLDHMPPAKARRIPKWARRVVMDDGTLFVPDVLAPAGKTAVFLCASYDGVSAIVDGGHAYYPAEWLAREYPDCRETIDRIAENVRAAG